jgi:hypothetical protein
LKAKSPGKPFRGEYQMQKHHLSVS